MKRRLQPLSYVFQALMTAAWSIPGYAAPDVDAPPPVAVVSGVIKAVDADNQMFILSVPIEKTPSIKPAPINEMKIAVDLKTTYSLDGKPTTMDRAMIVGNGASVVHLGGLALKVHAKSKAE